MIRVRLVFLARLREVAGMRELPVELETGSMQALRNALSLRFDAGVMARLFAENVRIAVNQSLWDGHGDLADGAEIAFLPPVTGG